MGGLWLIIGKSRSELLKDKSEDTKAAIQKRIPIGTEISKAKAIMEMEGLGCRRFENEKYAEHPTGGGSPLSRGPADFLWCDSGEWGFIVTKRWQVVFVDVGGLVTSVVVSVGLTGP
jgi:hypothetical protein